MYLKPIGVDLLGVIMRLSLLQTTNVVEQKFQPSSQQHKKLE